MKLFSLSSGLDAITSLLVTTTDVSPLPSREYVAEFQAERYALLTKSTPIPTTLVTLPSSYPFLQPDLPSSVPAQAQSISIPYLVSADVPSSLSHSVAVASDTTTTPTSATTGTPTVGPRDSVSEIVGNNEASESAELEMAKSDSKHPQLNRVPKLHSHSRQITSKATQPVAAASTRPVDLVGRRKNPREHPRQAA